MHVLDRVSKVSELKSWRLASREELKVIQGLFLRNAGTEKGAENVINAILAIFAFLCLCGVKKMIDFILIAISRNAMDDVLFFVVLIILLLGVALALGILIIKNITRKTAETYYEAINTNKLRVVDVQIVEVISLRGIGKGTDGHRVKVRDMNDVYCEENIVFTCCNGYQKTKGLLIDVPIREDENGIVSRKCVIPCKENDPRLWNMGMRNYSKLVK